MKFRRIASLVINAIAVIASLIGLIIIDSRDPIIYVKFFTILTNCLIMISGLISIGYSTDYLIKGDKDNKLPAFVYVLKLITATSALVTFLTVVCYLQYATALRTAAPTSSLFWNNILHHYVGPLAFILGFIFLDIDRKYIYKLAFFGPLLMVLYSFYMIPICLGNPDVIGGAPYPFLDKAITPIWLMIILMIGFLAVAFALSFLLWLLNRIAFLIFIGEEVKVEETSQEEEEVKDRIKVTEEDKEEVASLVKAAGYQGPKVYHISKREDKLWQVKFANGKKAIKLFNTQAEAIVFAKQLAKTQEGSIRVHSLKGKIRKAN